MHFGWVLTGSARFMKLQHKDKIIDVVLTDRMITKVKHGATYEMPIAIDQVGNEYVKTLNTDLQPVWSRGGTIWREV